MQNSRSPDAARHRPNVATSVAPAARRNARKMVREKARQKGAVLIAVLVCLGVASMLLMTMVTRLIMTRRQMEHQVAADQAYWVCQAGLQRAVRNLAADRNYQGETWTVPSSAFDNRGSAEVVISLEEAEAAEQVVTVNAAFPAGDRCEMRCTQQIVVPKKR